MTAFADRELGWLAADRKESSDQSQYARYFQSAANQARTGDRDTAQSLVGEFAQLAEDPHVFDRVGGVPIALIQHIASCLNAWKLGDFEDADSSFFLKRDAYRPDQTTGQHVAAMRAYLLLLSRAKGVEAARAGAAAHSGLDEEQVRHLVDKDRRTKVLQDAALFRINKRLHKRVLNPPRKKYQRRP